MRTRNLLYTAWTGVALAGLITAWSVLILSIPPYDAGAQSRRAIVFEYFVPAAVCDQDGPYVPLLHSNSTLFPAPVCLGGSNTETGLINFLDSETDVVWWDFKIPDDWLTGTTVALRLNWRTSATTGNVVWQVQTVSIADGEVLDPAMNTAQTVTDAAKGTTLQMNDATIANLTTTGWAAGETATLKTFRVPTHASDTIGATAQLRSFTLTLRRGVAIE